jgi:carbamoyltransferase
MPKPRYILGTGLSHNGSAVLLKDGKICVAIEKERITRQKHDGGNDTAAINYCLEAEGITLSDVELVVQCANFEVPGRGRFHGMRVFQGSEHPPVISISHHLAHAWSVAGTCHFENCAIMVIDGCGSPFDQCTDVAQTTVLPENIESLSRMQQWCEKDSFYHFDGQRVSALFKDFSPMAIGNGEQSLRMQTTEHSIGGFYSAVSHYVFGNLDDVGKLMGLAPYGKDGACAQPEAFRFENGRLFVNDDWKTGLDKPSGGYSDFKADFQYYADIALWAQQQVEKAIAQCFQERLRDFPNTKVGYSGGVALNAVANARLLDESLVEELYLEPAAGDNGLALGCAFYGWLETLNQPKVPHDGSTCFGKEYVFNEIKTAFATAGLAFEQLEERELLAKTALLLNEGKTVG